MASGFEFWSQIICFWQSLASTRSTSHC